ncbi:hypothetical protein HK098_001693 [Nowakowskiella sp. JEL0407]|nr:hypothetical protein HK098_001693 [Nowakowskiella sp. JEL0407]
MAPNAAWMTFLSYPLFHNVSCLSWSPDGIYLAVGSGTSSTILIWNAILETCTPLRNGSWKGTREIKWSNDGSYLVQVGFSNQIRFWETHSWTNKFKIMNGKVHSVFWMKDNKTIIYGLEDTAKVYAIRILNGFVITECAVSDLAPSLNLICGNDTMNVTGPIKKMELNASNSRLAVTFGPLVQSKDKQNDEDDDDSVERSTVFSSEVLAMFTFEEANLRFRLNGYIEGPKWNRKMVLSNPSSPFYESVTTSNPTSQDEEDDNFELKPVPDVFQFAKQFDRGALLSVAWENGKIGFIPCHFKK